MSYAEQRLVEFVGAGETAKSTSPLMIREHLVLLMAQSTGRRFTARLECFESRHFKLKRNGDVLLAVSWSRRPRL
jgi:hypothetical protein